ncbi:MAG: amino acid ABC transporter substrate-binding protein [Betaproteobacteria bacterium]|nr:amino acid ABC transporter substrate-binding protein [Betaproteobacteria bacterium]NBX90374.1 amino acid ABC transporter substrate-binding protein [Betaproteobacteria bacterium]
MTGVAAVVSMAGTNLAFAQSGEPIKFGLAMPMTGSQALFGTDQVKAAQWAVADINAKGGVNGRPLEMILIDTQADPQLGINAAKRLTSVDKVPIFLTSWSAVVKAVAPIANREKVLELSVGANSPEIATLGDYVYTTFPLADVDVSALANYTYASLGKKTAAVLYINNDSGVEGAGIYKSVFEKAGGKVVAYEAYDAKATEFTGAILKVKAANPDIIHIQGLITDLPQVIAQMRQLGITQRVSTYSAGYNPKVIEQLGAAAEGLIVTSLAPGVNDNPNVAPFVNRWLTTEKRVPNGLPYTQYLYDSPYIVADLYKWLAKNKLPATGENLRRALITIKDFDLPMTGMLQVGADHRVKKPVYLLTVEKGAFVPLATIK